MLTWWKFIFRSFQRKPVFSFCSELIIDCDLCPLFSLQQLGVRGLMSLLSSLLRIYCWRAFELEYKINRTKMPGGVSVRWAQQWVCNGVMSLGSITGCIILWFCILGSDRGFCITCMRWVGKSHSIPWWKAVRSMEPTLLAQRGWLFKMLSNCVLFTLNGNCRFWS